MNYRNGDYIKAVGDDSGIVYYHSQWMRFQCIGCLHAMGIAKRQLNNGSHNQLYNRISKTQKFNILHDKDIHNAWILSGKPIQRKG